MIQDLAVRTLMLAEHLAGAVRHRLRNDKTRSDDGLGTLEAVIITLGLMTVAALLVAAITAAVRHYTTQIK